MLAGATRGRGGRQLAAHLLSTRGQTVRVLESRGVAVDDFRDGLRELVAGSAHGRTDRPVHHVHVDPPQGAEDSALFARWEELYEHEFGLSGVPRLAVEHTKRGRTHRHYVYSLVDDVGRCADLSWERARREKISRIVEHEFGLPMVPGKHNRAVVDALRRDGRHDVVEAMQEAGLAAGPRPQAAQSPQERHQAARTAVPVAEVRTAALAAWRGSDDGQSLEAALAAADLRLARGDRGPVLVDRAGGSHSLTRTLSAAAKADGNTLRAAAVKSRIADINLAPLQEAQNALREARSGTGTVELTGGPPAVSEAPGSAHDLRRGPGGEDSKPGAPPASGAPGSQGGWGDGSARRVARDASGDHRDSPSSAARDRGPDEPRRSPSRGAAARQARRLAAVAKLRRLDVRDLTSEIESLRRPAPDRVRLQLRDLRKAAERRLDRPALRDPPDLVVARRRHERARQDSTTAFQRHAAAQRQVADIQQRQPRGLVPMLTGRRQRWRREIEQARDDEREAREHWDQEHQREESAAVAVRRAERRFAPHRQADEKQRRQETSDARRELVALAAAERLLKRKPGCARMGVDGLLERAREWLAEQERQRAREAALVATSSAREPHTEVLRSPRVLGSRRRRYALVRAL